ncbi:cytochrome c family protein [Candidatus Binatia bacterium]|nr:cytochrome c family protein [Candidatus Binatia bacterium]
MAQIFPRSANDVVRASLVGLLVLVGGLGATGWFVNKSGYVTRAGLAVEQPIQFSHKHHAGELGIDCRYCHSAVERSHNAGIPATQVCMNCHNQIWADSPTLEPVRSSWRTEEPIVWNKVYDLPNFVYFNHSIHVTQGIGCATCHGRVDQMNLIYQVPSLQMEWCLGCHRQPEKFIRPRDQVFNMAYEAPADQLALGARLVKEHNVHKEQLVDCSVCHR